MAKKMIIKGVGTFMAKKVGAEGIEVITLGTLQNLKIDLNVEIEDIFGGDGLFPIDNLVKSKAIEITATDAKFDLDAIQLMMGSSLRDQVEDALWVLNEQHDAVAGVNGAEVIPVYVGTLAANPEFSVRLKDTNKLLFEEPYSAGSAPTDGHFAYNSTDKKIVLPASLAGSAVVLNYKRRETVDIVDILAEEVPFPVSVVHHGSFLQKDGTYQGIETELYACRAKGTYSIDAQRATASANQVSLVVLDPERADGKLGTIKRYSADERV